MSDLLALAAALRQLSPEQVAKYLPGNESVSDLLDLAKALLSKRELEKRIRRLCTKDLSDLRSGKATVSLQEQLLATDTVFSDARSLVDELTPIALSYKPTSGQGAGLTAYQTLLALTELLFAFEKRLLIPVKAGLRAPDARELGETLKLSAIEVQTVYQLGVHCGFIHQATDRIHATRQGFGWLELDNEKRWLKLAKAVLDLPPLKLRQEPLLDQLVAEYPLIDPNQFQAIRFSEILGLTENQIPTPELSEPSGKWISKELPETSDRFVVQGDLSLMTLGPISAKLHRQLDVVAQAEDLGLASRFRLSALTISHALESGMSAAEIRKVLSKSIQPLPQPVEYLLAETDSRFGSIKIADLGTASVVRCQDPILRRQIIGESALRPLMFELRDEVLFSRLDAELVYLNLRSCGYAAIRVDEAGHVLPPRIAALELTSTERDLTAQARALMTKEATEPSGDDVMRQLQFALRNKLKVGVRVSYPDGSEREHLIEPLGLAGSRVRGRDTAKEAEITLPLSRITSIWLA
ncbi:MAG: hypothetical protein EBS38_00020 [Actinobacteria bacterium]|nr:hypothetical protein [Actinomycetota bacterium]